jgi:hypothetical protein
MVERRTRLLAWALLQSLETRPKHGIIKGVALVTTSKLVANLMAAVKAMLPTVHCLLPSNTSQ